MKAILIDSTNRKLTPIDLDENKDSLLEEYFELIGNGCQCIDAPYQFNDNEMLLVDDEGVFSNAKSGFKFPDWHYPVVGNGIIVGVDNETGDSTSITSPIEAFNNIIWCDEAEIQEHVSKILGNFETTADLKALEKMANYELIKINKELRSDRRIKDSLSMTTISKYFGVSIENLEEYHFLAFQYGLSNELANRLEDCMASF